MSTDTDIKVTNLPKASPKFQSLSSLLKAGGQALLLDCSGSMGIKDDPNQELRRIDHLRNLVKKFEGQIRQFIFYSDNCYEVSKIPEPSGGTGLHEGLKVLKRNGIFHVILITDGRPDIMEMALVESESLQIDAFFVGDPTDTDAIEFLKRLTRQTNGKFGETTLNEKGNKFLEDEILFLIEDQSVKTETTINL